MRKRYVRFVIGFAAFLPAFAQTRDGEVRLDKNVVIPMRDGIRLGADIYRPEEPGKHPVLLCRTPYNKKGQAQTATYYARHGYIAVVEDSRGLNASEGIWYPYKNEGRDGYDTQQWIGRQPWCDGNIGMFGLSYPAYTQVLAAPYRSPFVKAIMPEAAQSSNFEACWSWNGIYHLALAMSWGPNQQAVAEKKPKPSPSWVEVIRNSS